MGVASKVEGEGEGEDEKSPPVVALKTHLTVCRSTKRRKKKWVTLKTKRRAIVNNVGVTRVIKIVIAALPKELY